MRSMECKCGFYSEEACAYVNTMYICHLRPNIRAKDNEELGELVKAIRERRKWR